MMSYGNLVKITQELRELSDVPSLEVYIVDIAFGSSVKSPDVHGRLWREFDPLANVAFCARRDGMHVRIRSDAFQVPQSRHARTAYCYLGTDATEEEKKRASAVFGAWAERHGHLAEE